MEILLASASPRRRELMSLVCSRFSVAVADVDEAALTAATPAGLALCLAGAKAAALVTQNPNRVVIGCDTVVELAGRALGKPRDSAEVAAMIGGLAGRSHQVHTGVSVWAGGEKAEDFVSTSTVWFSPVPEAAIAAYAATPEPYDKAGGYGVQGWAARYIPRIEGCYYNVMGLPVAALYECLCRQGLLPEEETHAG